MDPKRVDPEMPDHDHGVIDPTLLATSRGIWAIKWSFAALMATASMQLVIVYFTSSVALLADTIHNFGDASTAIPLWIAFRLASLRPSRRYPYGYGKVEDLAGVAIVLLILTSAIVAGYESVDRFLDPRPVQQLWAVAVASIVGFIGNELVAVFRIRVGREIHSVALIADGNHARVDGLTSLGVLASVIGIWVGFPLADPLVGLIITVVILRVMWSSAKAVFMRMLDGVEPEIVDEIRQAASQAQGVEDVSDVRVRWIGHWLHAEINLSVSPSLLITEAHELARQARHEVLHQLPYLSNAVIHVDPVHESGEAFHRIESHVHDDLEPHFHA